MKPEPDAAGVPLAHYLSDPLMGVRFSCAGCQLSFDVATADVVARLMAAGLGGERTGIRTVARLSTKPCSRCGAVRWETRPAYRPIVRKKGPQDLEAQKKRPRP